MIVRDEFVEDRADIGRVITASFGRTLEADLVTALRDSGDVAISLVAEDAGLITGHILFSKLRSPERCLVLAPVSVAPDRQRQGIGSQLIREGLTRAGIERWRAVFVLGEPDYYERFGFARATAKNFDTPYPRRYFMALELSPSALGDRTGPVVYAPPFLALG